MVKKIILSFGVFMICGIIYSGLVVGYFYVQGYMESRTIVTSIASIVARENCVAEEKIYLAADGHSTYSMQDEVQTLIAKFTSNDNIDSDGKWYLSADLSGDWFGDDASSVVSVTYDDESGNKVLADSYTTAAPKMTPIITKLNMNVKIRLRLVPSNDGNGYEVTIPVRTSERVVGLKYYKATNDNQNI